MAAGHAGTSLSLQDLMLVPHSGAAAVDATLRSALTGAVESVFVAAFAAAVIGLAATLFTPPGRLRRDGEGKRPAGL